MNNSKKCFQCGREGKDLYGYTICDSCKKKLGLFTDEKIKEHIALYESSKDHSYEEEISQRLDLLEKDYIKKRLKLLHIQDRVKGIE